MSSRDAGERMRLLGTALLVLIIVITGSYIRTRTVDESDAGDWLVIVQLGLCLAGGGLGVLLIRRHGVCGTGGRLLTAYLAAVLVSVAFSSYFTLAAGYWLLLAGTSLLCIGLVSSTTTQLSFQRLEFVVFCTLALMLLKDSLIEWLLLEPPETGEIYRLGESTTSANAMGLIAAMGFCMSFFAIGQARSARLWSYGSRALFIAIVVFSRSRVGLFGLVFGMAVRWWFHHRLSTQLRSHLFLASAPCWVGSLVVLFVIAWTMGLQPVIAMVDYVNRSEDSATLMSVTGRTEIWSYAIERILDGTKSILVGHGYGVSKLVLNETNWAASFFAYHSHNTFLEVLLSTGILGTVPFLLWFAYSLKWFTSFSQLPKSFSLEFTLRAVGVIGAVMASILTESDLANKIGPVTVVFMFYVLALDRRAAFGRNYGKQIIRADHGSQE